MSNMSLRVFCGIWSGAILNLVIPIFFLGSRTSRRSLGLVAVLHGGHPRLTQGFLHHIQLGARDVAGGGKEAASDQVGVTVGTGAAVLEVTLAVVLNLVGDTAGGAAGTHTEGKLVQGRCLVEPSHALVVVRTVEDDVLGEGLLHAIKVLMDLGQATGGTGLVGGEVGVEARAVPIPLLGLHLVVDVQVGFIGLLQDPQEAPPAHHQVVAGLELQAGADLVLPLAGHHLGVGAGDLESHAEAHLVVLQAEFPAEADQGAVP
eukprot:98375_1